MDAMKESGREALLGLLWGVRKGLPERWQWSQLEGEAGVGREGW